MTWSNTTQQNLPVMWEERWVSKCWFSTGKCSRYYSPTIHRSIMLTKSLFSIWFSQLLLFFFLDFSASTLCLRNFQTNTHWPWSVFCGNIKPAADVFTLIKTLYWIIQTDISRINTVVSRDITVHSPETCTSQKTFHKTQAESQRPAEWITDRVWPSLVCRGSLFVPAPARQCWRCVCVSVCAGCCPTVTSVIIHLNQNSFDIHCSHMNSGIFL